MSEDKRTVVNSIPSPNRHGRREETARRHQVSGLGREMGPEGMDAYPWMKSIYLDPPPQTPAVG
jgi:hypothetical protein